MDHDLCGQRQTLTRRHPINSRTIQHPKYYHIPHLTLDFTILTWASECVQEPHPCQSTIRGWSSEDTSVKETQPHLRSYSKIVLILLTLYHTQQNSMSMKELSLIQKENTMFLMWVRNLFGRPRLAKYLDTQVY